MQIQSYLSVDARNGDAGVEAGAVVSFGDVPAEDTIGTSAAIVRALGLWVTTCVVFNGVINNGGDRI